MTFPRNLPVPLAISQHSSRPRRNRGLLFTLVLILTAGIAAAFAGQAMSEEPGWKQGFGHGGWQHGGMMGFPLDPAEIEGQVDRGIRHLAIEIDATAEQQDKLRAIVNAAIKDLLPLRDQRQAAHERARDLLTRPTIDRTELEKFRAEHMAMWDAASKRIVQAFGDAAQVLTPAQRQKLAELMSQRRGFWQRWHRG